jgi:hypothetical protein
MKRLLTAGVLVFATAVYAADDLQPVSESDTAVICLSFANEANVPTAASHLTAAVRTAYGAPVMTQIDVAAPSNPYCFDCNCNAPPTGIKRPSSFTRVVDWSFDYGASRHKTRTAQYVVSVGRFPPPTPAVTPTP